MAKNKRPPGINAVRKKLADGSERVYYYHRATGKKLEGEYLSREFYASYGVAEKAAQDRNTGLFCGLVRKYTLSPEFSKLRASTQREYERMLTKAEERFGKLPIAALEDPRVRQDFMSWRAEVAKASGDREADNRLSIISAMLTWGKENGVVFNNHIAGFRRLYSSDRSDKIWLPEHVEAFMKVAPIEMQRSLILALHTGQRQGDLLRLVWGNYDGAVISLRQGKYGRKVEIPCTNALRRMLDSLKRVEAVVLTTKTGRPWQARYFGSAWKDASDAAGITDLHFHDLRGTAVTMLAEAGCTIPQIATITGHSMKTVATILDKYLARTRVLAGEAMALFENAKSTEFANRLQTRSAAPVRGDSK
jgi:integrase